MCSSKATGREDGMTACRMSSGEVITMSSAEAAWGMIILVIILIIGK